MIQAERLHKSYRLGANAVPVLRDVTLQIPRGCFAAIVGRSGSGKSSLLNILAGLDLPDSGEVSLAGTMISELSSDRSARFRLENVGFVFQFFNLLPTLSLLDNVAVPAYLARRSLGSARKEAAALLDELHIGSLAGRLPHEVSGGEVQRAAIARALINKPQIIFADEPTGNLDTENGRVVLELFRNLSLSRGLTALLATHDPEIAEQAELLFRIENGRLIT